MAAVLAAVLAVALLAALAAAEAWAIGKAHYSAAAAEVVLDLGPAVDAVEAWKVVPYLAEAFQADLAAATTDHLYAVAVKAEVAAVVYPASLAVLGMALAV